MSMMISPHVLGAGIVAVAPPTISSPNGIAWDSVNGVLLYDKSSSTVLGTDHAASNVKLLTALVVMDWKAATLASDTASVASGDLTPAGIVNLLQSGDVLTLEALMKVMLVVSGNDAALCLARVVGDYIQTTTGSGSGGVTRFVAEMNTRAAGLGMSNTTVTSPEFGWTTSLHDLALLASAAYANATIRSFNGIVRTTVAVTGANARTLGLFNLSELINGPWNSPGSGITYSGVLAAKIGILSSLYYSHTALWRSADGNEIVFAVADATSGYNAARDIVTMIEEIGASFPYLNDGMLTGKLLLSGDMQAGTDRLLLSGDLSTDNLIIKEPA